MIEETWSELTVLRQSYRNLEDMAILYKDDESSKALDADTVTDFEAKFTQLIKLRDDPDTPFMVSHMIDVDTCVYGATDEGSVLIYEWGQDSTIITDSLVLEEMRQNDRWMNEYGYSENSHNPDEQQIRRDDELAMSRVHNRVDLEDDATTYLLKYAGLYHYVNHAFGFEVTSLSEPAKLRLIDYLTTVSKKDIERISAITERLSQEALPKFAEAFLATEFGDDYGGAILDIAEKATPEQSKRVFELVQKLRTGSKDFAHMFESIDPSLTESTEHALNERITDSLIALQEVASRGRLQEDVAPHRKSEGYVHNGDFDITIGSVDEALDIMEGLSNTFGTMHAIIQAPDLSINQVNADDTQFAMYRLASDNEGQMLVYVRPEGAYGYDKQVEYGNGKGVEASISFMVDPLDPHRLIAPKDSKAVSIRFDHEGRQVSEAPDSARRDPTRRDGLISVDVSSGMGRVDLLPVKIGRMIAAGNRIRARRVGSEDSLHHNTNYFDQEKYGDSEGFAWLGRSVIRQIGLLKKTLRSRRVGRRATNFGVQADLLKAA